MQREYYQTDGSAGGKCPQCFTGTCKKHPLQDHGERSRQLQARAQKGHAQATLKRMYEKHVLGEISRMEQMAEAQQQHAAYQTEMDRAREGASKRKRKAMSRGQMRLAASGLNARGWRTLLSTRHAAGMHLSQIHCICHHLILLSGAVL